MSHASPLERLVNEVQVLIVGLKKEYFSQKEPLNDDEILVHKLCVRLENVLRYGFREKYSFMGVRKDYWNFISESVSNDESVRFVQAIPDFKTNPGKGRAFLREALMQKSLADTLQRTIMNTRITKDYYGNDSVMRNEVYFQTLIHSLYDLNAVEFHLPHQGYDLDKSFPSFARKIFNSGNSSRHSSVSSIQSFQPDPLQNLRTNVSLIELVVNSWLGKITEHTENNDSEVSLLQLIDKLALLREHIILLKTRGDNEVEVLKTDIEKLKEEKLKSDAYMEQRLNLVHDHYKSIHDTESSAANEKINNTCEKLITTEHMLTEMKTNHDNDTSNIKNLLTDSQEECEMLKAENKDLSELLEKYKIDVANLKEINHSCSSTNKILEGKLSELQKNNTSLKSNEKEMAEKNCQIEQLLKIKETEHNVLQDAFQKSTGRVAGSVEELKTQLCSQQNKTEVLNSVCSTNEGLLNESKALLNANNELSFKIQVLEEKLLQEANKKEEVEKIVSDLKCKYTEDMKHQCELQNFVGDIWDALTGGNEELDDLEGDGLMTKSMKCNKDAALQKLAVLQSDVAQWKKAKEAADAELIKVKSELSQIAETQQKLDDSVNELADAITQKETAMNDLAIVTKKYVELKGKQSMENDSWNSEKETLIAQCEELNQQCDNLNNKYTVAEKEITFLKVELAKLAKEKDEEKTLRINLSNEVNTLMEESRSKEEEFTSTVSQHKQDLKDIKSLLINSTKEKHELWQKKEHLEQELTELKEGPAERWVTDTEVTKCTSCEEQFTLTRRKHHCRLCGHIFCSDCSNRWIKNNMRRKRVRACNNCANSYEENTERREKGSSIDNISDMNSTSDHTSFQSSDEEIYDAERRVSDVTTGETINENPSEETATDGFEVLAAADVSIAGAFGSNQEIKILGTDQMKSSLIPVCHTDDELAVQMEKIDIDVTAGMKVLLPVIVPGNRMDLSWEFTSYPKDVGFGVAFKPNEEGSNEHLETIIPLSRYISHKLTIHGKMTIENPGTYYLVFDNSYSRLTTKNVRCLVGLARSKQKLTSHE